MYPFLTKNIDLIFHLMWMIILMEMPVKIPRKQITSSSHYLMIRWKFWNFSNVIAEEEINCITMGVLRRFLNQWKVQILEEQILSRSLAFIQHTEAHDVKRDYQLCDPRPTRSCHWASFWKISTCSTPNRKFPWIFQKSR